VFLLTNLVLTLFHFCVGKAMVISSARGAEGSRGKGVFLREPFADTKGTVAHESGVVDIASTSRRRVIDRDVVCSLLTDCLQDVRSFILVILCLFALLMSFNFFFSFVLGYEIDKRCRDYYH
jgi:hypothetical protein